MSILKKEKKYLELVVEVEITVGESRLIQDELVCTATFNAYLDHNLRVPLITTPHKKDLEKIGLEMSDFQEIERFARDIRCESLAAYSREEAVEQAEDYFAGLKKLIDTEVSEVIKLGSFRLEEE